MINEFRRNYDWDAIFSLQVQHFKHVGTPSYSGSLDLGGTGLDDIQLCLAAVNGEGEGDEWAGVFLLKDGHYLTVEAGCDNTGWDCQSGASFTFCADEQDAFLFGLTQGARQRLGYVEGEGS